MKKGELLNKALYLAVNIHKDQYDKGNNPYILHPLKVMHYLKTDDEELQCIAILHDSVEDSDLTEQDLEGLGFTNRIIRGVVCLTKIKGQTHEEYKTMVMSNIDSIRVKMCDIRHNTDIRRLKGLTEKDFLRMQKYQIFYSELAKKEKEYN